MWVRSLGLKDPLEKGTETHFSYSCLENPMDREVQELNGLQSDMTEVT